MQPRERLLAATFVELADTLVKDYDLAEFCHFLTERCVELLPISQAGLMLAHDDALEVMASSSERSHVLEVLQQQRQDGPCWDAFRTGRPTLVEDLRAVDQWPDFAAKAIELGFLSIHTLPLRLRRDVIGALNLLLTEPGGMSDEDVAIGQALADAATIGILQARAIRQAEDTAEHLHRALESRVAIEQAKGVISENLHVDVGEAFQILRSYARSQNRLLTEVAEAVVTGYVSPSELRSSS